METMAASTSSSVTVKLGRSVAGYCSCRSSPGGAGGCFACSAAKTSVSSETTVSDVVMRRRAPRISASAHLALIRRARASPLSSARWLKVGVVSGRPVVPLVVGAAFFCAASPVNAYDKKRHHALTVRCSKAAVIRAARSAATRCRSLLRTCCGTRERCLQSASAAARSGGVGSSEGGAPSTASVSRVDWRQSTQCQIGRSFACARVRPAQERCEIRAHAVHSTVRFRLLAVSQTWQTGVDIALSGDVGRVG